MYEPDEMRYMQMIDEAEDQIEALRSIPEAAAVIQQLQEESTDVQAIIDDYDADLFMERFEHLRRMCDFYKDQRKDTPEHPVIKLIDKLIQLDAQITVPWWGGKNNNRASHNAFVFRFVAGMPVVPDICRRMFIAVRTFYKYQKYTLWRMMVLLYGFDGVRPSAVLEYSSSASWAGEPVITAITEGE